MEPDRVEMSVGSGMVNGDHLVNGSTINGSSISTKAQGGPSTTAHATNNNSSTSIPQTNGEVASVKKDGVEGTSTAGSILKDAPPELIQALSSDFYLPMARLISRSAQSCWNDLSNLVERLASMPVTAQHASNANFSINDQSKTNLDKKDLLLNFAKSHKDTFIKLLVLLQWSRKSEDVRKTIELNLWLQQRRQAFNNATGMLGAMMRGLADSQVPNPDLYTASEVLATGDVSSMPKLDYMPQPALTPKRIIRLLRRLDVILCTRMALTDDLPPQLRTFQIHDGRVTFAIGNEFSFDVSIASEDPQAKFGMVDFGFLFVPSPSITHVLHEEITYIANNALDKDGLEGVYNFLHDLTLSYKLNELAKQARNLAQGLWNGHLRVEVLRRTLVVQYWLKSPVAKSWIEIGIHSGKKQDLPNTPSEIPGLKLRWLKEGKIASPDDIYIDLSRISIEGVLRQVIAQHTNYLFDAMYGKLSSSPMYTSAELEIEQSASTEDPADCYMDVQLSRADVLHVNMEPIGGLLILSPASERINRLQFDLGRSKNLVDDFAARVSNLRSSTAESNLLKSLPNSQWQRLEGLRINSSEAEALFGISTTRTSFLRLQQWAQKWTLAVTQSATGDYWWLTQSAQPNVIPGSRVTKIVDSRPLCFKGSPTPAYLERLAAYTTGVIALQCNAEFLNQKKHAWRLPDIPTFDGESRLPALQFAHASILRPRAKKAGQTQSELVSFVNVTYHGFVELGDKVVIIAKAPLVANLDVLKDLASSKLDSSVAVMPEQQQVMIRLEPDAGSPVIDKIISKLSHLENIVACAAAVKRSTEHGLQSLSLSSITILYSKEPALSLSIDFGQDRGKHVVKFLPPDSNPHQDLSQWVVRVLKKGSSTSSLNLSNIFVVLRMTRPILFYLKSIQKPVDLEEGDTSGTASHLRVHVLNRQPTAYALQYFSDSSNFIRGDVDSGTPKKLLARFEILAMKRGDRLMWVVRPAIEEFNSYNRPSFTSEALKERLNQEVFMKQSPLWLALDGGAACPSDKPEQLLSAIHSTIVDWAKVAIKPETKSESLSGNNTSVNFETVNDKKLSRPNLPTQKMSNTQPRPNGVQKPQQLSNTQKPQNTNQRHKESQPPEVITLD